MMLTVRKILCLTITPLLCLLAAFANPGFAQTSENSEKITPSHVYQSTEELRLRLEDLNLIDMNTYKTEPADTALRHPRHVIQKVRECHQIISKILKDSALTPEPVPGLFSVREIRPSDVKVGVQHLLKEVEKLDKNTTHPPPPFVADKVPSDVYNNLKRICRAIKAEIVPADVYQVALAVRENMEKIARSQEYQIDIPQERFEDKIPGDVYREAWDFLSHLRILALNPDYAIPGGVVTPNQQAAGDIAPVDVIALMNDALSDTNAIKYTLGVREQMHLPPYQPDKTPSDVFGEIYHAHLIVHEILTREKALDHEGED